MYAVDFTVYYPAMILSYLESKSRDDILPPKLYWNTFYFVTYWTISSLNLYHFSSTLRYA